MIPRMTGIADKVAWILGAGSGIGRAGAVALAEGGARVVLSGQRAGALDETAATISAAGGTALVEPLDIAECDAVQAAADRIDARFGRLDIVVNSAGHNTRQRHWADFDAAKWDRVVDVDIKGALYCAAAALPMMRAQKDGLIINVASWAARHDAYVAGVAYTAAKRAMLAMNASINMEEGVNGIRACAICPAEVATPLLQERPLQPTPEDRARMLQPADLAATIRFVAELPPHVCLNEILISPTWNRAYIGDLDRRPPPS